MHMSILNALPASMTLAPLNDVNNGGESESESRWLPEWQSRCQPGIPAVHVHGHAPFLRPFPISIRFPFPLPLPAHICRIM